MDRLVFLRGNRDPSGELLPDGVEAVEDPEAVLERLRADAGGIRWVALAPDLDDPGDVARRIRAVDPDVGVVLLGRDPASWAELPGLRGGGDPSLNALTADIAHQVATPMTAILGYAELLQKSIPDEKNRGRAARIVEQVHRVSALIEKLLNVSHPSPGAGPGTRSGR